jgi:hypothetical protein
MESLSAFSASGKGKGQTAGNDKLLFCLFYKIPTSYNLFHLQKIKTPTLRAFPVLPKTAKSMI